MDLRRKLLNPFVVVGVIAVIGIVAGLGFGGVFDSDGSGSQETRVKTSTPTSSSNSSSPSNPSSSSVSPSVSPAPTANAEETPIVAPNSGDEAGKAAEPSAKSSPGITQTEPSDHAPASALPEPNAPAKLVQPDPDFEHELRSAGISTRGWKTDFSRHTAPFDEIFSGGPPQDGIPPIDEPNFTPFDDADEWLGGKEPVIAFERNGDARAYPLQILTWHEIVNDVVGGVPVAVTFCPLCNSSIVFERTLNGVVHDFGTSGKLRRSDLVMWDRQTETWWQQLTGEGIVGELAGHKLGFLPAAVISWEDFKAANPQGKVLSRDTGFSRDYGRNPYVGYDRADNPPFLFAGDLYQLRINSAWRAYVDAREVCVGLREDS